MKNQHEKMEFIINGSGSLISMVSRDYVYEIVNDAFCEAHEQSRENIVGKDMSYIWGAAAFRHGIKPYIDKCLQGRECLSEAWADLPALGRRYLKVFYRPYRESGAEVTHVVVTAQDMTAQKRIQDTLERGAQRLQDILNSISIPVFVINSDHNVIYWNRAIEALSGIPAGEVLGTNRQWRAFYNHERPCLADILVKGTLDDIPRWYGDKCTGSRLIDGAYEAVDFFPDLGEKGKWLYCTVSVIRDLQGRVNGAVETLEDITDAKIADLHLKNQLHFQQSLLDAIPIPVYHKDARCIYTGCNTAYEKFLNLPRDRFIGKTVYDVAPGKLADLYHAKDLELLNSPGTQVYEAQVLDTGQVIHDVVFHKATYTDPDGRVGGMIGIIEDITDRRRAEERLLANERRYRNLVEATSDWVWEVDREGRYIYASPKVREFLGYRPEEVIGKTPFDFMQPDEAARIRGIFSEFAAAQKPFSGLVNIALHREGREVILETNGEPVFDADGNFAGYRGIDRDITERSRIERQLKKESDLKDFLIELHEIAPSLTDRELYNHFLDKVVRTTESAIGFFHLVSEDQKSVILTTWNAEALDNCTAAYETHYPIEQAGNWVDCVRARKTVVYNDFPCSPNQRGLPEGHTPVRRFMSVPVMEEGRVRIIFGVGNKVEEYSEFDALRVQVVANELQRIMTQRVSERRFKRLLKYAPIPLAISDNKGSVIYRNNRYLETIGYTQEDVSTTGDWWRLAYPDEDCRRQAIESWGEKVARAIKTGSDIEAAEYSVTCKDGTARVMIISGVIFDDQSILVTFIDITERKRDEERIRKYSHDLAERMKELRGLYSISETVRRKDISQQAMLQECASLISQSYQYPEVAACRITWEGDAFGTADFRPTAWMQSCPVMVHGRQAGTVEVCYLEERPEESEGPFLAEERDLINSIAELLGRSAERVLAEEEREKFVVELQKALSEVRTLSGLLPICASCKKIRDDKGFWNQVEMYISKHTSAEFSHGICPECAEKLYPELSEKK